MKFKKTIIMLIAVVIIISLLNSYQIGKLKKELKRINDIEFAQYWVNMTGGELFKEHENRIAKLEKRFKSISLTF